MSSKRRGEDQAAVHSAELLDRGLSAGKCCRFKFNSQWYKGVIDSEVYSGCKVLAEDDAAGQLVPVISRASYLESIKSEEEWVALSEAAESSAAALKAAKEMERQESIACSKRSRQSSGAEERNTNAFNSPMSKSCHATDIFITGSRVLVRSPDSKWQPCIIERVTTEWRSQWKKSPQWQSNFSTYQQTALVLVAYSSQGDKYLVPWNGVNCDPFPLVLAPRLLRIDKSSAQIESACFDQGFVNGSGKVCGFMRIKQLSWHSFIKAGIKEMTLTFTTSATDGSPSVKLSWSYTIDECARPRLTQAIFTQQKSDHSHCDSFENECALILTRSYFFIYLLVVFLKGSLPSQWARWDMTQLLACAQGAFSPSENIAFTKQSDLDAYSSLLVEDEHRHPYTCAQ
jgi:hypothetical protein